MLGPVSRRLKPNINRLRKSAEALLALPARTTTVATDLASGGLVDEGPQFVPVSIDGRIVEFAIERHSSDPIAHVLAERCFPSDATSDLWRHLVEPQHIVIDVGAHLGTYSLAAAAIGAQVLAVEASPLNAGLLKLAARRNSFANLDVLQSAAAAKAGIIEFAGVGPWGHRALPGETGRGSGLEVAAVVLDDAIRARDWERVDLIKLDVEGSELDAMAGLVRVMSSERAPALLMEANGHMLHQYGLYPHDLLAALESYDYRCHLVDSRSPGRLVPVSSSDIQTECVADYLAFKAMPEGLSPWLVDRPFARAEIIHRVTATCQDEALPHREYGARLVAMGPAWLTEDESIKRVQSVLAAEFEENRRASESQST